MDRAPAEFGRVDVLINNARSNEFADVAYDGVPACLGVHLLLLGGFSGTRAGAGW